jgi:predicted RNA-binding protein with PIN domain
VPYIIDGHNLIAEMEDIDLRDAEDERALVERLTPLAAQEARTFHLFFDRGHHGDRRVHKRGRVRVRFAVPPRTADDAIHDKLREIKGEAGNWIVVSSDREILDHALRVGARTLTSADFIRTKLRKPSAAEGSSKPAPPTSPEDIEGWEALFRRGNDHD